MEIFNLDVERFFVLLESMGLLAKPHSHDGQDVGLYLLLRIALFLF